MCMEEKIPVMGRELALSAYLDQRRRITGRKAMWCIRE